jgi:GNAT superfamily N-acetyltransferase
VQIRRAQHEDEAAIAAIVERAYGIYVERIGMRPGPMDADHGEKVRRGLVFVAEDDGAGSGESAAGDLVAGLIVLVEMLDHLLIENVAVDPDRQGEGIGRQLLGFAEDEARRVGLDTLALYTHEKMSENLALYARLGYVETERRTERGFSRVFMEKRLAPPRSSAASTPT